MILKKNKLFFHNNRLYVSVRDYEIQKCVKKNEELTIKVGKEQMTLTKWNVALGMEQFTPDIFKSKTGGKDYELWDYLWVPEKKDELKELAEMGVFG